jgi:hypothetical protein
MVGRAWKLALAGGALPLACGLTHDVGSLSSGHDGDASSDAAVNSGGSAGSAGASGTAGTAGTASACGDAGEKCCAGQCNNGSLKCVSDTCVACGNEGQPCCDSPLCVDLVHLTCAADGRCRSCPWAGATCGGTQTTRVCVGVGDESQCVPCGQLSQRCCNPAAGKSCPAANPTCCNGIGGDGCTACNLGASNCTCKVCCVRCANWAPGNFAPIPASPDSCPTAGANHCADKGGKVHAQWQSHCP